MVSAPLSLAANKVDDRSNTDAQGQPRTDIIPTSHADLEDLIAKAQGISEFAAACQGMECPILDCEVAGFFQDNLDKAEDYLKHMLRWLEKANDAHFAHFMSLRAQSTLTGERLAEVQEILAYQEYVMGIANAMLDIADISDLFETYAKDPSKLNPENFEELVNHVWRLDKLIKKVESGSTNVAKGLSGGKDFPAPYAGLTPDALGLNGSDWNALKGYTGEVLGMVHETRKGLAKGEKLFEAFNKPGGARANLLSALGSIASAWGKAELEERAAFAQQLSVDLAAEDLAAARAYEARRQVLLRIEKAEEALAAVQAANTALQACMVKAQCPLRSKTRPGNNLPDFIQIGPNGTQIESWAWALSRIQIELDDVRPRLAPPYPELRDHCPGTDDGAVRIGDDFPGGGPHILIGSDSTQWCRYQGGNGTPTGLTPPPGGTDDDDGDDPRDAPPPEGGGTPPDDGDDPRDVPQQPCEQELAIINRFLAEHGDALRREIADPSTPAELRASKQSDLDKIEARKRELEKDCPAADGDDPRDTSPPGSDGDDPRDIPLPPVPEDEDDGDDPRDAGPPNEEPPAIRIYVKAKSSVTDGQTEVGQGLARQQIKLLAPSTQVALPGPGADKPQTDHDREPVQGTTDDDGNLALDVPAGMLPAGFIPAGGTPAYAVNIDSASQGSVNALMAGPSLAAGLASIPVPMLAFLDGSQVIGGDTYLTFTYPASLDATMQSVLALLPGVTWVEVNFCRDKQALPGDPLFTGKGAWQQDYDNQWAIKRVGFDSSQQSAWNLLGADPQPVVVAVIDTGIDWNHLDIYWANLWSNPLETPDNGIDDDNNGYVDDIIGWDFYGNSNKPWDHDGHGTFVAGVIAAAHNDVGIAGINPHARIMVLKALNNFGHSRASYLAQAIVYAADNGARIINMSVGGKHLTRIEQAAIDYARDKDVLIVVASGNEGVDISGFGPAGAPGVLSVGATGFKDEHQKFSNWGENLDIVAPGLDVLGLRARRTDTMRDIPEVEYVDGANYVGSDRRYYRASGTSFAAPIVTGVASTLLSKWPHLGAENLRQLLLQSAQDIGVSGVDQLTGYGLVDARAALSADPDFFITGAIDGVEVVQEGGATNVRVIGSLDASRLKRAWVELGAGESPAKWKKVTGDIKGKRLHEALGDIDAGEFGGSAVWTLRLIVEHENGQRRENRFVLNLG
ncbi:hypothetical protein E4634_04875 [Mangrovimicrobium sediminis]|uniref:Peptidase S8/S53 domain-containing protein n=1 Tax=Mangrovimicrobium sediminis TaxID=2562682 RepID=A0A4Z0M7E2_9GAMM|nr:S8 family peptidase [Haliea sp. SAOS-164]TGD75328.1 hypothetical protein E4634_04875 [Haliea sp. SAOS-164]